MLKCPCCGSNRLQTTGGENGNPFDRRPEKAVCLDCGRTVSENKPKERLPMPDISTVGRLKDKQSVTIDIKTHTDIK